MNGPIDSTMKDRDNSYLDFYLNLLHENNRQYILLRIYDGI